MRTLHRINNYILNTVSTKFFNEFDLPLRPMIEFLKEYFNDENQLIGAEIGVFKGFNALSILRNLNIETLYLIDSYMKYDGYDKVNMNYEVNRKGGFDNIKRYAQNKLKHYNDKIRWLNIKSHIAYNVIANSVSMNDFMLDFVYIDGNHSYSYVINDLKNYWKIVRDGGVIGGHDIDIFDVASAVNDFKNQLGSYSFGIKGKDYWFIKK